MLNATKVKWWLRWRAHYAWQAARGGLLPCYPCEVPARFAAPPAPGWPGGGWLPRVALVQRGRWYSARVRCSRALLALGLGLARSTWGPSHGWLVPALLRATGEVGWAWAMWLGTLRAALAARLGYAAWCVAPMGAWRWRCAVSQLRLARRAWACTQY